MPREALVLISEIIIPATRMRYANHIEDLAASIRQFGLLHPITLREDGEAMILVAGHRRLQAVQYLLQGEIRAHIIEATEVQALMIEIDENLQRAELTVLERVQHIAERKRLWESLYPQTMHGRTSGDKGGKRGKRPREMIKDETISSLIPDGAEPTPRSFVVETAERIGKTPRSVSYDAEIGANLSRPAQDLLTGTAVADKYNDLLKLSKMDPALQVAIAQKIHDHDQTPHEEGGEKKRPLNVLRAYKAVKAAEIAAAPPPLPTGPFRVLVIDPPWTYAKRPDDASKRENVPYSTMTQEKLLALPIADLAADDAILWLWSTNAHLRQAFVLAEAWGFAYKTLLTWDKDWPGMGEWLRGQTEHCLVCARGNATVLLTTQTTLLREKRGKNHSRKPEGFYALVESLCPGSKVELFARQTREGWQSWGAEAPISIFPDDEETQLTIDALAVEGD